MKRLLEVASAMYDSAGLMAIVLVLMFLYGIGTLIMGTDQGANTNVMIGFTALASLVTLGSLSYILGDWIDQQVRSYFKKKKDTTKPKIPATSKHDAGAYGRCSYCFRYSRDPHILSHNHGKLCDCGEAHGYSGSFELPNEYSMWNSDKK